VTDVLIYAEDPGAGNFVACLPPVLALRGFRTVLIAAGHAQVLLQKRGIAFEVLPRDASPADILGRWNPRVVIAGTGDGGTLARRLISEGRARKILTVATVDARLALDRRFQGTSGDSLEHAPDWMLVPDQWTREAFLTMGCSAEQVLAVGQPHLDYVRSIAATLSDEGRAAIRKRLFGDSLLDRRVVTFIDEPSVALPESPKNCGHYTLKGRGQATGRTQIVLDEFIDTLPTGPSKPYLVFRIHPRSFAEDYKGYLNHFDFISSSEPAPDVAFASDLVVGMTSMLLLEAAAMGRPTFSIVPQPEEAEYLPTVACGVTPTASTREQLRSALPTALASAERSPSQAWVLDGAIGRIVDFVASLLETAMVCSSQRLTASSDRRASLSEET